MEEKAMKVYSQYNNFLSVKIIPGHFATNHSHINYYMDMTTLKTRQSMALAAATVQLLTPSYVWTERKSLVHIWQRN